MEKIVINKNRGWRGLAEIQYLDDHNNTIQKMIFSFSQPVWDDMLKGFIVLQDKDNYIVLKFDNTEKLPAGQRSVLLKYFTANVLEKTTYSKDNWIQPARKNAHEMCIYNFIKNRNNHTTSDWNCIGVRVVPMI